MASSSCVAILLIIAGIIHQLALSQTVHESNRLARLRLQSDLVNVDSQFNQRPTQFIASPQSHRATTHSRGTLVMPANNQVQVNNFHSTIDPAASVRSHPHQQQQQQPTSSNSDYVAHDNSAKSSTSQLDLLRLQPGNSNNVSNRNSQNNASSSMEQLNINNNSLLTGISERDFEFALRQANSDESVFQTSPAIPTAGHSFDQWSFARSNTPSSSEKTNEQQEERAQQQPVISTTDQSNSIFPAQNQDSFTGQSMSSDDRIRSQVLPIQTLPTTISATHTNQSIELSNQVFYEGPATAPPANDYYFSSAERVPNNERASSNIWWSLGLGYDFEKVTNLTREDYLDYCAKSELLISNKQRLLCRSHPKIMSIVARGLKIAIDECQSRFTSSRWNCSLVLNESLLYQQSATSSGTQVFGEVMKHANRERSFLNAIIAAGLAHSMTKACSQGELPEECSCDKHIKSKNSKGKIEWVACSDDIDYGARFSRDFTETGTDNDSDTTSMINTHNYEVGRRVFKSATDITCQSISTVHCLNGENGLCQTKRCWRHLGPFTDIGDELMKRYESATHVQQSNKDPHKLRPVRRGVRRPKRKDLVYIDESPDYCSPDFRLGVLGTQNRRCNSTSAGPDSCSLLCCGRGYQMVVEEVEEECNCKFVWCCQVKCDKCKRRITNDVCN